MRPSTRFRIAIAVLQLRGHLLRMVDKTRSRIANRLVWLAIDAVTILHNRIRWIWAMET
ncbi:hypothetical protein [Methylomonas methanica]|uniref:Transposase n=1 Tax=Methylomonas methanica (strain DSM 25384 / MC09) TaxID=857087 RepID=G0A3S7_METMM|nr:hypothetical protein [Methylomonas methanica]AEG02699.1 hypothetical protein Metme_4351 [Methylomonas methanica MC09]